MNKLIGITGYMGSGKSTVIAGMKPYLKNVRFVDVDDFRRKLLTQERYRCSLQQAIPELRRFPSFCGEELNCIIYSSNEAMEAYKKVLYRFLFDELRQYSGVVLIEWSLVLRDQLLPYFDKVIWIEKDFTDDFSQKDLSDAEIQKRLALQTVEDPKGILENHQKRHAEFQYRLFINRQCTEQEMIDLARFIEEGE